MKRLTLTLLLVSLTAFFIKAQDNHYESTQQGSQNAILSGASLSRWVDQTAVINNPATMISTEGSGVTFNTAALGLNNITFTSALGQDIDLQTNSTIVYPGLIAGEIASLKKEGKRVVGFAIYTRNIDRYRFTKRITDERNIIDDKDSPGDETFIGLYSLDSDISESAASIGMGQRISDKWAWGFTMFVINRNQRFRENIASKAITHPEANPTVGAVGYQSDINLSYWASLIQFKTGLSYKSGDWSAGLVITTPTVRVFSGGDMLADINLIDIHINPDSMRHSYIANTFLNDQKPQYKYPLSIGGGVSRKMRYAHLSFAVNWYAPLERYLILDPGNTAFLQPPSDKNVLYTPRFLEVWNSHRSVVNISLSSIWNINETLNLLSGFRTDHHFAEIPEKDPPGFQLNKKIWNRYHFNGGAEIRWKRSYWLIGLQYSLGRANDYRQPFSFDGATEENFFQGERSFGDIKANSLTVLLSFYFQIGKKSEEN